MAKKSTAPAEQVSEDIVDQELILPNEEAPAEVPTEEVPVQQSPATAGYPSRDFHS